MRGLNGVAVILVITKAGAVGREHDLARQVPDAQPQDIAAAHHGCGNAPQRARLADAESTTLDRTPVEQWLDRRMRDQRGLRATLGQPATLRLAAQADGEYESQYEHGHEADGGVKRKHPRGRPWIAGGRCHTRAFGGGPPHLDDGQRAWTKEVGGRGETPKSGR
jgi:hypothetical protein